MNLGETIYKYRISKNFSQGDLAEMLDVSRQSISKWENNSATPDLDKIVKLSEIFGISLDELVKGELKDDNVTNTKMQVTKTETNSDDTNSSGRKIVGTILLCMAFLVVLFLSMMGSFAGGLLLATPFIVCGIICFVFKQHVGLWCGWAVYFMIDIYLRFATGTSRSAIYQVLYYQTPNITYTWYLIIGWALNLALILLTVVTVLRFKNKPLEMNRKNRTLLVAGLIVAVVIKIVLVILPTTAYYSYLLAHLISFVRIHSILYTVIDWIKIGIVVALIVNLARYRFKQTIIISLILVLSTAIINFAANFNAVNKITQNNGNNQSSTSNEAASVDKSIYEHGLDVVFMLEEITESEEYVNAFSSSEDIMNVK